MSAEWCDTDPPVQVEVGKGDRRTVKVFISTPTRAEAKAAHHDATTSTGYYAATGEASVAVGGVESPFRVRVEGPGGYVLARSEVHQPGQIADVRFPLAAKR
jgi:hypothetical protein